MKRISIIKADGSKRAFSYKKLLHSVERAGANRETAKRVAKSVLAQLPREINTNQLYDLIYKELRSTHRPAAQVYSLRRALADLPPEVWEKYIAKLFSYYGYITTWNVIVPGASVEHQVDVIAKRDDKVWLIECKHHYDYHRDTGLGEILQVQARLEDVQDGYKIGKNKYGFTGAWLVTNTKFSNHNKRYAEAKKINLSGWRYPEKYSLERLIQDKAVYPLTILSLDKQSRHWLMNNNILTLQDVLANGNKIIKNLGKDKADRLARQVQHLLDFGTEQSGWTRL
ncbi:MAG: ATP cone domain-containing protein [Candidatus Komeilibacteria bacterium]